MLRQSPVDCAGQRRNARPASDADTRSQAQTCRANNYPGRINGPLSMAELAGTFVIWVDGRDVRDRTGLTGTFDVDLNWTPDRLGPLPLNAPPELVRAREAIDPNGPSLFTAVQEQLGLRLEPKKDKVEVCVIDRIDIRPRTECGTPAAMSRRGSLYSSDVD